MEGQATASASLSGRALGHYEVLRLIGRGGFGEVYEARDRRLGRSVAIKVLPDGFADLERLERFEREARVVAALNHPSIVTLHSVEEEQGVRFLTMELVEGETLSNLLSRRNLELGEFFRLATSAADALATAHDHGVVHRDLKPANIMVTGEGRLKILDFGLAKLRSGSEPSADSDDAQTLGLDSLTRQGQILGTGAYMSPEQVRGRPVDHRSDIFSLGIVLFEMLTLRRPFQGATAPDLYSAILREPPPAVSDLRPVPRALDRIVEHCLEKDPASRFQTARDVSNELKSLRNELERDEILQTRGRSAPPSAPRRRSKWALPAALLLAVTLALVLWPETEKETPQGTRFDEPEVGAISEDRPRVVVLPLQNLGPTEEAYFAAGMTEEITTRLATLPALGVISRTSAILYADTDKPMNRIGEELGVGYALEGAVRWARAPDREGGLRVNCRLIRVADDTLLWAGSFDRPSDDVFAVQSEVAAAVVEALGLTLLEGGPGSSESLPTGNLEAYQYYLRGRFDAAQPHLTLERLEEAAQSYERAVELDPEFAMAWAELASTHGRVYFLRQDASESRRDAARAAIARAVDLTPDSPSVLLAQAHHLLWVEGDREAASERLLAAERGLPNSVAVMKAKAEILEVQGSFQEALDLVERAFALSPLEAILPVWAAHLRWILRRYPEAIEASDRAIALAPEGMWPYLYKFLATWSWRGIGDESRSVLDLLPNQEDPWAFFVWYQQGLIEGTYEEALVRLRRLDDGWMRIKMVERPRPWLEAQLYAAMGEAERAASAWEEAALLLEEAVRESPENPRLRSSLGISFAALGRTEEAVREGELAVELFPLSRDAFYGLPYLVDLAHIHTLAGNDEAAIDRLEDLMTRPSWLSPGFLRGDPRWEPLLENPRFRALLED